MRSDTGSTDQQSPWILHVQPRTACTRHGPDPPTFANHALRVSNADGSFAAAHISTHKRAGAHCRGILWIDGLSVSQPQGRGGRRVPRKSRLLVSIGTTGCIQTAWPHCPHQAISRHPSSEPDRLGLYRSRVVRLILITVTFTSLSWHCSHGRGKLCGKPSPVDYWMDRQTVQCRSSARGFIAS